MRSPAQITIVGYGKIARDAHGPAWQRAAASGKAVVRTVVEPTESGCIAAATAFPGAEIIRADARRAFDMPLNGDVVDVCTPGDLHHEMVMGALAADCNVLVEKPLAHSAAEVEEIIGAQNGAVVQVCQTVRLTKPVQQFRAALAAGRVGRITRIQVVHHARHILSEAEWVTRSRPDGTIFENAIHFLDLVHYLLDLASPLSLDACRFHQTRHRPVLTGFEMFAHDDKGRHVTMDFLQDSLSHSALISRSHISATGADAELRFYPDGFRLLSGLVDPLHDLKGDLVRLGAVTRQMFPSRSRSSPHDVLIEDLLKSRALAAEPLCGPRSVLPGVATAHALAKAWTDAAPA